MCLLSQLGRWEVKAKEGVILHPGFRDPPESDGRKRLKGLPDDRIVLLLDSQEFIESGNLHESDCSIELRDPVIVAQKMMRFSSPVRTDMVMAMI